MIKQLQIGNLAIENNIFLAPMAGYTDYAFRKMALPMGYGMCFTELVSAKGLIFGGKNSATLLKTDDYSKTSAQIFGSDPYYMRSACEGEFLRPFSVIDINMGCPVPKVYKNGEGSALLKDIHLAKTIIEECVKSGKIITVKIRKGLKEGDDIATDFAKMAEDAGAKLITIHARVREAYYSGEPDYNSVYKAKKAVSIPVVANGGIFSVEDAKKMFDNTGADGIMLARGGVANPFLVCDLLGENPKSCLKDYIISHLKLMRENMGERRATLEFRKFVPYYFRGMGGLKDLKMSIYTQDSTDKILNILEQSL